MPVSEARSKLKKELQDRQREWLKSLCEALNLKPSQIADRAQVSDTTLTRLLNNPAYAGTLSHLTIDRIKSTFSVPGPEDGAPHGRRSLLTFAEAERVDIKKVAPQLAPALAALTAARGTVELWRLKTGALEDAGYLAGDILVVDPLLEPKPQDAVCAQVNNYQAGGSSTVWRIFDPPYLVASTHDRTAYKPMLIDADRVIVRGVVVESLRPYRLSATR